MSINNSVSLSASGSFSLRMDGHCDTVTALKDGKRIHIDLNTLEHYVDLQFFALYIKEENDTVKAVEENNEDYAYYQKILKEHKKLIPILTAKDLKKIGAGKVGALLAMENAEPLAEDSEAIFRMIQKGYRSFGITWSNDNSLAGGANTDTGLTDLGRETLKTMNGLPVLVDLAHMNRKSFFDSMAVLEKPPIVTHTCCYGLCPHKRNLEDDAIDLLSEAQGVMGITFVRTFLQEDGNATVDRIVDHLIYAAERIGIDSVVLGSDFDGTDLPLDMEGQCDIEKLREQMLKRDFRKEEINKIMGVNMEKYLEKMLG